MIAFVRSFLPFLMVLFGTKLQHWRAHGILIVLLQFDLIFMYFCDFHIELYHHFWIKVPVLLALWNNKTKLEKLLWSLLVLFSLILSVIFFWECWCYWSANYISNLLVVIIGFLTQVNCMLNSLKGIFQDKSYLWYFSLYCMLLLYSWKQTFYSWMSC